MEIYNRDPYPPRNKKNDFRMETKPRVPPFREVDKLLELKAEIRPYKQSWHLSFFINTEVVEPRKMLQLVKFGSQLHVDKMQK